MSDILREVDEDLRRERLAKLWQRYGVYLVGAAVLVVAAVGGWRAWEWYEARLAAQSGARFEAALQLVGEGRRFEAEAAFNALAREGTSGYRLLARFRSAAEAGRTDPKSGVTAYDSIAADSSVDRTLRDLARVHAALLLVDTAPVQEIASRMEPLIAPGSAFRHSAGEVLGIAHLRAGQREAAAKLFAPIISDQEAPPTMRNRVGILNALIVGGAAPPPAPTPAAPAPATQ